MRKTLILLTVLLWGVMSVGSCSKEKNASTGTGGYDNLEFHYLSCAEIQASTNEQTIMLKLGPEKEDVHLSAIEDAIREYNSSQSRHGQSGSEPGSPSGSLGVISYTFEKLENITVTSDVALFGKEAGEDIGEYFQIVGSSGYLVKQDLTVLGRIPQGTSLKEYVEMDCFALPVLSITFKEQPKREDPVEATFTVTYFFGAGFASTHEERASTKITLSPNIINT